MFKSILFTVFSLLCVYASIGDAKPSVAGSEAHSAIRSVMSEMGSTIDSMKKIHSIFQTMADGASTGNCSVVAASAAANITADCKSLFASGVDLSKFSSLEGLGTACSTTFSDAIVAKCAGIFSTNYKNAINVCGANNASDVSLAIVAAVEGKSDLFVNLTGLVSLGNAICTKADDGSYCINGLINAGAATALADLSKVNNALQNAVCTKCTKNLINALAAVESNAASAAQLKKFVSGLQFLCTTDPTNSTIPCMDSVQLLFKFKGQATAEQIQVTIQAMGVAELNTLCSPCTMSVLNSIGSIASLTQGLTEADIASLKGAIPAIKGACVRDAQNGNSVCPARLKGLGEWAGKLFLDTKVQGSLAGQCSTLLGANPSCSPACAAAISQVLGGYGCCLGLITKTSDLAKYAGEFASSALIAPALSLCTITFPPLCAAPASAVLPVRFVLDNLRFSWASTNAQFTTAFKQDIASAFSLDINSVNIVSIGSTAKGSVTVLVQLSVDSSVAEGYKATIKSRIESQMSFGQTSAAASEKPNESKINQAEGVQADPQASTVGPASTSGAVAANTIIGTVILTIASLIAIKFY